MKRMNTVFEAGFRLHFVYILLCHDGTLYTGYTPDLIRRMEAHNRSQGARYTRGRLPVYLVYHEVFLKKSAAMKREYAIKQLSRKKKLELIAGACFCLNTMASVFARPEPQQTIQTEAL